MMTLARIKGKSSLIAHKKLLIIVMVNGDRFEFVVSLIIFSFVVLSKTSGRLTWEEWYLKKRIESLKNEKRLHEKMHKVSKFY